MASHSPRLFPQNTFEAVAERLSHRLPNERLHEFLRLDKRIIRQIENGQKDCTLCIWKVRVQERRWRFRWLFLRHCRLQFGDCVTLQRKQLIPNRQQPAKLCLAESLVIVPLADLRLRLFQQLYSIRNLYFCTLFQIWKGPFSWAFGEAAFDGCDYLN